LALADWSSRRLLIVWLVGLSIEGLILMTLWNGGAAEHSRQRAWKDSVDRVVEQAMKQPTTPMPAAERDSVLQLIRDSVAIKLAPAGGLPAFAQSLATGARVLERDLWIATGMAAMIVLTIPLALMFITSAWLITRRRRTAALSSDPA
jgi:hypothetical protein